MSLNALNSLLIIIINGSLVLLTFLMVLNPLKTNKKANFCLGVTFLLWSTFWLEEIFELAGISELSALTNFLIRLFQFLTSLFFYLSVVYFTNPNYKIKGIKHFILPFVYFTFLLVEHFSLVENKLNIQVLLIGLILFQAVLYVSISFLKIRKHKKKVLLFSSDTNEIDLNWLENMIVSMLTIVVIILLYNVFLDFATPNVFMNFTFLLVIFMIAYNALKQKEIYPLDVKQRNELILIDEVTQPIDVKRKIISDKSLIEIKVKLAEIMSLEKPYLDSTLNLIKLADFLQITPHQLSYAINKGFNENFFEYVNKFRVEEAKKLLITNEKENLTILAIAFESGFNSKTAFNTTFKKFTNKTPSEFKKFSAGL